MRHARLRYAALALLAFVAACSSTSSRYGNVDPRALGKPNPHEKVGKAYQVNGVWYVPKAEANYDRLGFASWYGPGFHGRLTANGEIFDEDRLTAAHPTLPLPSIVEVTNPQNGKRVTLRVNDRGPFANNRILDLSKEAARRLGTLQQGVATVRVRYIGPARIDDAIVRVGARERGQALALKAGTPSPRRGPVIPREALPDDADRILADLDPRAARRARPDPYTSPAAPYRGAQTQASGYFVQVGAYADSANAAAAASRLPTDKPVALHSRQRSGRSLTLVRLGPFDHPLRAEEALRGARRLGFPDAHIIEETYN